MMARLVFSLLTVGFFRGWFGAALFGVLLDFAPRREPDPAQSDSVNARRAKTIAASGWRWLSTLFWLGVIGLATVISGGWLAPLIPVGWLLLVNRIVWPRGSASPRAMFSREVDGEVVPAGRSGFLTVGLSVLPPLILMVQRLLPPPFPWLAWLPLIFASVAVLTATFGAVLTALRLIKDSAARPVNDDDLKFIAGITKMTEAQFAKGGVQVAREGEQLQAAFPVGMDSLLEDEAAIEKRLADRHAPWEVAMVNLEKRWLILEPASEETLARRAAQDASGGLFGQAVQHNTDDEVIDLGIWNN
ncbi:hypothetical protein [Microbacterium hydrocarbonoxydans]|uniref:hypothetical protein n=1 Tax=Microbacterium hydrocarbonoxydans TaxID=273678 RepID=UPI003D98C7C5